MNLTELKRRVFGTGYSYRFSDITRKAEGHHLAMYSLPFRSRYALTAWVIPNGRGGWRIAPQGDVGPLPEAPATKPTRSFGPLGAFRIASAESLEAAAKPGTRLGVYTLPLQGKLSVCWLETDTDAESPDSPVTEERAL